MLLQQKHVVITVMLLQQEHVVITVMLLQQEYVAIAAICCYNRNMALKHEYVFIFELKLLEA